MCEAQVHNLIRRELSDLAPTNIVSSCMIDFSFTIAVEGQNLRSYSSLKFKYLSFFLGVLDGG